MTDVRLLTVAVIGLIGLCSVVGAVALALEGRDPLACFGLATACVTGLLGSPLTHPRTPIQKGQP